MRKTRKPVDDDISLIAKAIDSAKAKTIRRINKQLARMSPNDLVLLERLLGTR